MDCCGCDGDPTPFDAREAREDRERYHVDGPDGTTRMLLDMIGHAEVDGATVLDVGGGIGVIDHELLAIGAARAVLVDASEAYVEAARAEAAAAGLLDRMEIRAGDFVRTAEAYDEADIVTLDRVVCCYRHGAELVSVSAAHARRLYGLVLPRDRWYVRWIIRLDNLRWRLKRSAYRAYAHANGTLDARVEAAGLRLRSEALTWFWRVALFERVGSDAHAPTGSHPPPPS